MFFAIRIKHLLNAILFELCVSKTHFSCYEYVHLLFASHTASVVCVGEGLNVSTCVIELVVHVYACMYVRILDTIHAK